VEKLILLNILDTLEAKSFLVYIQVNTTFIKTNSTTIK